MFSELPLFFFTLAGGLAAGMYAAMACFPKIENTKRTWLVPAVALVLLAIGGVALLMHLGHPERMLKAFRNISAGITQEGYATIVFGIVVVIDLILTLKNKASSRPLRIVGAVVGLILVLVMANAYYTIITNHALHSWETFALFVTSAAAMGFAFAVMVSGSTDEIVLPAKTTAILGILAAVAMIFEGVRYMANDVSIVPFVVGAVIAIAGAICAWLVSEKKVPGLAVVAFVCLLIAVAVTRYAFYLAI